MTLARAAQSRQAMSRNWRHGVVGRSGDRFVRPICLQRVINSAGGQLVTTDHGPACVFFYKDGNGSRISLFVRPMHGHDMTAPMRPMRRIPGYIWAQDGLGISMVTETPDRDLHRLANHARDLMGEAG